MNNFSFTSATFKSNGNAWLCRNNSMDVGSKSFWSRAINVMKVC